MSASEAGHVGVRAVHEAARVGAPPAPVDGGERPVGLEEYAVVAAARHDARHVEQAEPVHRPHHRRRERRHQRLAVGVALGPDGLPAHLRLRRRVEAVLCAAPEGGGGGGPRAPCRLWSVGGSSQGVGGSIRRRPTEGNDAERPVEERRAADRPLVRGVEVVARGARVGHRGVRGAGEDVVRVRHLPRV